MRAYGNSHPAFKSIAVVSIAVTSPLAVYSYNVINTSKTTNDFINGLFGAQPTNMSKFLGRVTRKTIKDMIN